MIWCGITNVGGYTVNSSDGVGIAPSGIQLNDVLVAHVSAYQNNANMMTVPSGWSQQDRVAHPSGGDDNITSWLYWYVAPASPPATFTWVGSGFSGIGVMVSAWRGVNTSTPWGGQTSNNAFDAAPTGLSYSGNTNEMSFWSWIGDSNALSAAPPSPLTNIGVDGTTAVGAFVGHWGAYYGLLTSTGATGNKAAATGGNNDDWVVFFGSLVPAATSGGIAVPYWAA